MHRIAYALPYLGDTIPEKGISDFIAHGSIIRVFAVLTHCLFGRNELANLTTTNGRQVLAGRHRNQLEY